MKKLRKGLRFYAIVTQFLLQTFALVILGLWAGARLDEAIRPGSSLYSSLFGIAGIFLGLGIFIVFVLRANR
jgi:hypothetical protein